MLFQDVDCNSLSSMYYVGQLVACIVLQLDDHDDKKEKGKPKIWLSLRLSLLHKCLSLDVIQEGMVCNFHMSHFIRLGSYPHCFILFTSILLHFGKETSTKGCSPSMLDLCKKLFLDFI